MKLVKKAKRGFTLVELVVVIAVIAILAAVSVGAYFGVTESANNSRLEQETKQMYTAIQTISLGTHENQSLGKDGLKVHKLEVFETDLKGITGAEYEVLPSDPSLLRCPTIVLKEAGFSAQNEFVGPYKTFEYYNPEIPNKKVIASTINGDFKIENISKIDVNLDADPITNTTVFFNNKEANWEEVYIYAWNSETNKNIKSWPGVPMNKINDDLYSFDLTSTFDKFNFNNNNKGKQTADLVFPRDENNCWYSNNDGSGHWSTVESEAPSLSSVTLIGTFNMWDVANSNEKGHEFERVDEFNWALEDVVLYKDDQFKAVLNHNYSFGELTTEGVNYNNIDESKTLFSNNSGNIVVNTSSYYSINYNFETNTLHFEKGETVPDKDYEAPGFISLAGTPTDWEKGDISLTATDETKQVWTGTFDLFKGEFFRFYFEGTWAKTYGYTHFANDYSEWFEPYKENNAPKDNNILVKISGVYTFTVDTINKNISVEKIDTDFTATFEVIGQVCGGTWKTNEYIEALTYNNETDLYEVTLEGCKAGEEFCIRRTNNWSSKVTTLASTGVENLTIPGDNIIIAADGDYVLAVNPFTMEITNTFVATVVPAPDQPGEGGEEVDPNPGTPVETTAVYLRPNLQWIVDSAKFAVYAWGGIDDTWYELVDTNEDGVYETSINKVHTGLKIVRINPEASSFSFDNNVRWNETVNLTVPTDENNVFLMPKGTWDGADNTNWTTMELALAYDYNSVEITETTLYFKPNNYWRGNNNPRYAMNYFGAQNGWISGVDSDGDGIYEFDVSEIEVKSITVIFCAMNPNAAANNWNNKWNQTKDLTVPDGMNFYTYNDNVWDNGDGTWSTFGN